LFPFLSFSALAPPLTPAYLTALISFVLVELGNGNSVCGACSVARVCDSGNVTSRSSGPVVVSSGDCGAGKTAVIETLEVLSR